MFNYSSIQLFMFMFMFPFIFLFILYLYLFLILILIAAVGLNAWPFIAIDANNTEQMRKTILGATSAIGFLQYPSYYYMQA